MFGMFRNSMELVLTSDVGKVGLLNGLKKSYAILGALPRHVDYSFSVRLIPIR